MKAIGFLLGSALFLAAYAGYQLHLLEKEFHQPDF